MRRWVATSGTNEVRGAREPARTALGRLPIVPLRYLQSGQQPVEATFVAAAAAVPNIATRAAASPTNFIFIVNSHSK